MIAEFVEYVSLAGKARYKAVLAEAPRELCGHEHQVRLRAVLCARRTRIDQTLDSLGFLP